MDYETRQRSRSRTVATNGEIVGIHLERGTSLRDGDYLRGMDGAVFKVTAKRESLSVVGCCDSFELARAVYFLAARHVRVQVEDGRVAFQSHAELDEYLRGLGFRVMTACLPFEPQLSFEARSNGEDELGSSVHAAQVQVELHNEQPSQTRILAASSTRIASGH